MPHNSSHPSTPKSIGNRLLYWGLSIAIAVVVGTVFVLMLGSVQGAEVDPVRFRARTFQYYRLPFTKLQISPTWYTSNNSNLETEVAPYLPSNLSRKQEWRVTNVQYGAYSDYGDAKIMDDLFWIVEDHTRQDSDYWIEWSKDHKEIAKLFWPIVSEIGVNDAFLILPQFVHAVRRAHTVTEFNADVIPTLVRLYNSLAADYAEAGSHDRAVKLTSLAIGHDPKSADAYILRASSYRELGTIELADKDLATSRELE